MTANAGVLLYTEVVPRIRSAIPAAVNCVGCEDAQEVIQDGTALAAKMMHNAEHAGKKVTRSATGRQGEISAGNIAYFTIVKLRNGCRSSGLVTGDVEPEGVIAHARLRVGRVPHYGVASVILVAPALCSRSVVNCDVGGPQEGPALRGGSIPDEVKIGAAHASSTVKPGFGTANWLRTGLQIRGVRR
jgi:hypothetical protein